MQVEPVRSFRSGRSYLTETCSPQVVIVCLLSACFSLMLGFWADDEPELRRFFEVCKGTGRKRTCYSRPWTALFVGNVLLAATAMMMQGYRSHFVFMGAVTLFGTCGVISTSQALAGFSSPGNIAFQAVLVLVGGIQDSGVLDHIFSRLLGAEQKNLKAFLRVQLVTAFLSAFVQQTTVVVAAAPALQRWAPQAGFTPREILLPIASVGGMSQNFMIVTSTVALTIFQTMPEAELQMLDPALGCIVLTALTCMYCTLATKPLLGSAAVEPPSRMEHLRHQCSNRYYLSFEIAKGSFLIGSTVAQAGLLSQPGASLVDTDFALDKRLEVGDFLHFAATAAGVAQIRNRSPGLMMKGVDPLAVLGAQRHRRRLFEVGIAPGSPLVGCKLPISLNQASCIAARRPQAPMTMTSPYPQRRPFRSSPGDFLPNTDISSVELGEFREALSAGDILLVEAFLEFADLPEVDRNFSFVAVVPESAPPRHGRPVDQRRGWLALLLLAIVIVCSVLNFCELVFLGLAAVGLCIILNIVHREAVLQRLNLPIFLTIAGGLGVGQAIKESGLGNAWAKLVISAGHHAALGHPLGILVALSFITSLLANLMSHTATAALMAPIAMRVCSSEGMNLKTTALVLVFSANAAFAMPFATSSNIMIKGLGPYDFADFLRFGLPLQLMCLIAIPALCAFQFGLSDPNAMET
ncbi:SAC1 [Symbiodinium necroappetens]|uniref:SAC1 protein n=1 Tax=Symbiodinium necroappetens TaxID=1628268 RepID=A0A812RAE1_9DINO|nr:SAC1 [Symbiodinium necroappetens]